MFYAFFSYFFFTKHVLTIFTIGHSEQLTHCIGLMGLLFIAATCMPFARFLRAVFLISIVNMLSSAGRILIMIFILILLLNGAYLL